MVDRMMLAIRLWLEFVEEVITFILSFKTRPPWSIGNSPVELGD
jgi:hypothetical protein